MTTALPAALARLVESRTVAARGEIAALDGGPAVRWSPEAIHGRAPGAPPGAELVLVDASGVLPVQLSRGRAEHVPGSGLVGRLRALWQGAYRDSLFVELRGRQRVRVHTVIEDGSALATAAADLPELRLEGSLSLSTNALLDLLAVLRDREARFVLGAPPSPQAATDRSIVVRDDDPASASLPAAAWLQLAAGSEWLGVRIEALELDTGAVLVGHARADGGAFLPRDDDVLREGDALLVVARCGELARLRAAADMAQPLMLERADVGDGPQQAVLLSQGDFAPTDHDPLRRPRSWRFATHGERAGLMVSAIDLADWARLEKLDDPWPAGASTVAVLGEDGWSVARNPPARDARLLLLAGDLLAVAAAEARG